MRIGGDPVQPEVGRIGDQDGEQAGREVGHPAARAAGVQKALRKPDPAVDVDQRVDELDERDSLLTDPSFWPSVDVER
jgi:hypothetical protein